jgi:hypothetical protein
MATPKVQTSAKTKRVRVPSDQEMEMMIMLWSYARARRIGAKYGLDAMILPHEFRVPRSASERPKTTAETERSIITAMRKIVAARERAERESKRPPQAGRGGGK